MRDSLKELIQRFLDEPDNLDVTVRIRNLRLSETDFTDELFETFPAESRRRIYPMLLLWTNRDIFREIVERRALSEVDWNCNQRLQFIITGLKAPPLE
jgi:hypothetical protein